MIIMMTPKTAISLTSYSEENLKTAQHADYIEIRLDLCDKREREDFIAYFSDDNNKHNAPVIATVRSIKEGGKFSGSKRDWLDLVMPWADIADYTDIERDYSEYAGELRKKSGIISSVHLSYMPGDDELKETDDELRNYGDLPKIVVTPGSTDDILKLAEFTLSCKKSRKPIITSIMGSEYYWARVIMPLFGSECVYCHCGEAAAEGQYELDVMNEIFALICGRQT
ncbi:type I 3-dehydroquinate dehydratase [Methanoplanus endosymbiosus]|uniref:3-dehydroquinate dehydratase n=1 Tax=Methanoplanus endosymbiosus TaxID=33865 RepID=A0A9E7PQ13_9EURY|nr:type I 3-dehydroquinate dehydratase [Methanoplanus endosymbiosus]UUX92934.1 type I 3-dehydroquinate dehydratase [Methanoplanus endosymbiosus]